MSIAGFSVKRTGPPWSRRRKIATITSIVVLLGAGAAIAAWLVSTTGQGSGKIGSLTAPQVMEFGTASEALFPGQSAAADFDINNRTSATMTLVSVDAGPNPGTGFNAACPEGNVNVNSLAGLNIPIAPGDQHITVPGALFLNGSAPDGCQGLAFTKSFRLTFSS